MTSDHFRPVQPPAPSPRLRKTQQRILQAAAGVFSAQGYAGATTRAIAGAAGVSELTLFRHFGSKKNLFMQVVEIHSALPSMQAALSGQLSGDARQDLQRIGSLFLQTISERRAAILMTLAEAWRHPEVGEIGAQLLQRQRQALATYFAAQTEAGRLRQLDPQWLAQAFLGMLFAYAINQTLPQETPASVETLDSVVAFFVDIFLQGVLVE
jgi:AcrR family transcriptional regulator